MEKDKKDEKDKNNKYDEQKKNLDIIDTMAKDVINNSLFENKKIKLIFKQVIKKNS